jgi:hypothetical protein
VDCARAGLGAPSSIRTAASNAVQARRPDGKNGACMLDPPWPLGEAVGSKFNERSTKY